MTTLIDLNCFVYNAYICNRGIKSIDKKTVYIYEYNLLLKGIKAFISVYKCVILILRVYTHIHMHRSVCAMHNEKQLLINH